jgi:hypothetical protein
VRMARIKPADRRFAFDFPVALYPELIERDPSLNFCGPQRTLNA